MTDLAHAFRLTHGAVLKMLTASVAAAEQAATPMSIIIVDAGGKILSSIAMDGVNFMTGEVATKKARTAAAIKKPTGNLPPDLAERLAKVMTDFANLGGGLPILHEGIIVGAIGVSGASPEQDTLVAKAGLSALDFILPEAAAPAPTDFDASAEARERCPCCKFKTLPKRAEGNICPVCYWEDDGQDEADADDVRNGPNGALSLRQAQANFKQLGVVDERFKINVRPPKPVEL